MFGLFGKTEREARARKRRVKKRVVRAARAFKASGHELSPTAEGMVGYFAAIDPKYEPWSRAGLQEVAAALQRDGCWRKQEEWRAMTWYDEKIAVVEKEGRICFHVSVECDGQMLSSRCPTVEKAFAFLKLYEMLIREQFYSVGPPWRDTLVFEQRWIEPLSAVRTIARYRTA